MKDHGWTIESSSWKDATTWRVLHSAADKPIYVIDAVADVTIGGEPLELTLRDSDGASRRLPLRPPNVPAELTADEALHLNKLLIELESACSHHQYLFEYSTDFPIPGYAVREAADDVDSSWEALISAIAEAGLSQHASTLSAAGVEHEWLGRFFAGSHHRGSSSDAYWTERRTSYIKEHPIPS